MKLLKCFSLFIDIGRENWDCRCDRSIATYISHFLSFYSSLEVDLTLFCEKDFQLRLEKEIEKIPNFKTKIKFENIEKKDFPYFSKIDQIKNIQGSDQMNFATKNYASNTPEYNRPEYVATMFSKPKTLMIAKERGLIGENDKSVAWIDFGIAHNQGDYISRISGKKLVEKNGIDKIVLFNRKDTKPPANASSFFEIAENVFVPGGFFVVPSNLIDVFFYEFNKIVEDQLFNQNLVDDDQTVLSIISNNDEICNLVDSTRWRNNPVEGDWFPIFDFLQDGE